MVGVEAEKSQLEYEFPRAPVEGPPNVCFSFAIAVLTKVWRGCDAKLVAGDYGAYVGSSPLPHVSRG
jgi:hypothetical protein